MLMVMVMALGLPEEMLMSDRNQVARFSTDTASGTPGLPSISGAISPMVATQPRIQTNAGIDLSKVLQQLGSSTYQAASILGSLSSKTASKGLSLQEGQAIGVAYSLQYDEKNFETMVPTDQGDVNLRDFTIDRIGAVMEATDGDLGKALHQTTLELISTRVPGDATPAEQAAILKRSYTPIITSMGRFYSDEVLKYHKEAIQTGWVTALTDTGRVASAKQIWDISRSADQGYWAREDIPGIMAEVATEYADDGLYDLALQQVDAIPDKPEYDKLRTDTAKMISEKRMETVNIELGQELEMLDTELFMVSESVLEKATRVAMDPNVDGAAAIVDTIETWASSTPMGLRTRDAILDRIGEEAAFRAGYNAGDEFSKMRKSLPDEAGEARDRTAIRNENATLAHQDIAVFITDNTIPGIDISNKNPQQQAAALKGHLQDTYPDEWATHWRAYLELQRETDLTASSEEYDEARLGMLNTSTASERQTYFNEHVLGSNGVVKNKLLSADHISQLQKIVGTKGIDFKSAGRNFQELESTVERAFIEASGGEWVLDGAGRMHASWKFEGQPPQFHTRRLGLMNEFRDDVAKFQNNEWLKSYRNMTPAQQREEVKAQYDILVLKYLGVINPNIGTGEDLPSWVQDDPKTQVGIVHARGHQMRPKTSSVVETEVPDVKKDEE